MREDDPITLAEACEIVFRNTVRPATLRAEAARGHLQISRIGRRDFTTLRDARELYEKCRVERKAPGSISTRDENNGLSETEQLLSARAAAHVMVNGLKLLSKDTSAKSTGRRRQTTR